MKELIAQGAEAKLFKIGSKLLKERVPKSYRLEEIDKKIRLQRTRREAKILKKAAAVISVPKVLEVEEDKGKIVMQHIPGKRIADCLDTFDAKKRLALCKEIGKNLALLHNADIIHGDITTSNMILHKDEIFFIDFGLSFIDSRLEHKAVDLHLLNQALESKHWKHYSSSFKACLQAYKKTSKEGEKVLDRLKVVEMRGRYKRRGS